MTDFKNMALIKLSPVDPVKFMELIQPILLPDEQVLQAYKAIRDGVVFTTKRIISINVQGMSGKKIDMTSLPYKNIQVFSMETAGLIDLDAELDLWFAGLGKVRFEFTCGVNLHSICRHISEHTL